MSFAMPGNPNGNDVYDDTLMTAFRLRGFCIGDLSRRECDDEDGRCSALVLTLTSVTEPTDLMSSDQSS